MKFESSAKHATKTNSRVHAASTPLPPRLPLLGASIGWESRQSGVATTDDRCFGPPLGAPLQTNGLIDSSETASRGHRKFPLPRPEVQRRTGLSPHPSSQHRCCYGGDCPANSRALRAAFRQVSASARCPSSSQRAARRSRISKSAGRCIAARYMSNSSLRLTSDSR